MLDPKAHPTDLTQKPALTSLLAIVVEAYTRVRDGIEENEVEGEVFVDLLLTCARQVQGFVRGWPDSDKLLHLLETQVASKSISVEHLRLAGVEVSVAHDLVRWFRGIHSLRAKDEIDCVYFEGIQSFQRSSSLNSVGETGTLREPKLQNVGNSLRLEPQPLEHQVINSQFPSNQDSAINSDGQKVLQRLMQEQHVMIHQHEQFLQSMKQKQLLMASMMISEQQSSDIQRTCTSPAKSVINLKLHREISSQAN